MCTAILILLFVKYTGGKSANPSATDSLIIKKKKKINIHIDGKSKNQFKPQHKKTERNKPKS